MAVKKAMLALLAVILCVGLAACSKSSGGTKETNGGSSDKPIKLQVMIDTAIMLNNFEKVEDRLKKWEDDLAAGTIKDTLNDRLQYNNLKYLSDTMRKQNIEITSVDWGWGEPLVQKESAAFLAKDGPDIIFGETQMPGFAMQGLLEPFPDALADRIRSEVVEAAWKPMEVGGKIYGLSPDPGVNIIVWNKTILKDAGVDPDKAPATWQELLDNAKKVFERGKYSAGGVYGGPNFGGYLRFGAFMKLAGGDFVDDKGNPTLNSAENEKAFEFLREINKYSKPGLLSAPDEGTFFTPYDKGQIAYSVNGPWAISSCRDNKLDCGVAPLPLGPSGTPANITIGAAFSGVPTYSKNKEAAFKVIEELIGNTIQQNIADANVRAPVLKSIIDSDTYKEKHPELAVFAKGLSGNVAGLPTFAGDGGKAWQAIGDAMVKAMLTDKPIKDILNEAQDQVVAAAKAGK